MARFYGKVGYGYSVENPENSGVWKMEITEKFYYGDVIKNSRKMEEAAKVNDDISVSSSVSIVADPYANQHFFAMKYVEWMGVLWVVSTVDVQSPRLVLRLGGVYNGPTA